MNENMKKEIYNIYIDEAGDLGIGRGTQWFVITAIIVNEKDDAKIRNKLSSIRSKLNLNEIHLRKIHDFYKTSYIISQIKEEPFTIINVLLDTNKSNLKDSIKTYNFMCRLLLERVSWYLYENNALGNVTFSSRGTSRDGELVDYVQKLVTYEGNEIRNVFLKINCKTARIREMLQLADICATSLFRAYEINSYGFITPCFMSNLKDKIYSHNGSIIKYGMKFYQEKMIPSHEHFNQHKLCTKK